MIKKDNKIRWKAKGGKFVMENLIFRLEDFYCDFYLFFPAYRNDV